MSWTYGTAVPNWVTTPEQRAGLYTAVITGGRPLLKQRPTNQLLPALRAAGFRNPEWIVSDRDAPRYESDGLSPLNVYAHTWAYDYAREHWLDIDPPVPDGFYGAFPGREWAARQAEAAGCWGVLQLDDNILPDLSFMRRMNASIKLVNTNGGLGLFADILAALTLSTNVRMSGAQLSAAIPTETKAKQLIRPGFPYSCFIEKVGKGREEWLGPYEEDIQQAFQYGNRADGDTAALVPLLLYVKESASKTGMRSYRTATRAVALQRLIPQGASIGVRATRSNGMGGPRIFHTMRAGAIRNPVRVHDPVLFNAARDCVQRLRSEWYALELEANREKTRRRAVSYAKKQETS